MPAQPAVNLNKMPEKNMSLQETLHSTGIVMILKLLMIDGEMQLLRR